MFIDATVGPDGAADCCPSTLCISILSFTGVTAQDGVHIHCFINISHKLIGFCQLRSADTMPPEYHSLQEVFSQTRATSISLHRLCFHRPASGVVPCSGTAGAEFFFVGRNNKRLCPHTDFHGTNGIVIKNMYPIPLTSSVLSLSKSLVFSS